MVTTRARGMDPPPLFLLSVYIFIFSANSLLFHLFFTFIYRIRVHISNPTNLMVTTSYSTAHVDPIQH